MSQEFREGINKLDIAGVVKEHKLEKATDKNEAGEKIDRIRGSLVIKAGEYSEVEVRVFTNKLTKEGKVRKVYETLEKIIDGDFKTLADGVTEEEAVKVSIWGNGDFTPHFREEIYTTEDNPDEVRTHISLNLGFGNVTIKDDLKPEDYKAQFDVELFIVDMKDEVKNNEETGRLIIEGYVPVYGGTVIPLELVAGVVEPEEEGEEPFDFAEQLRLEAHENMTINFWGEINHKVIITKEKKGGQLGRAKVEERKEYVNELVTTGGAFVDVKNEFDPEVIKAALIERENKMQEVLDRAKDNKKTKGTGLNRAGMKKPIF